MADLSSSEAISITVRLPRRAWPEELKPPAHPFSTQVSVLRERLACRQASLVIRVEGSNHEIQETLRTWEYPGFTVEEGGRSGLQDPLRKPGNDKLPSPPTRVTGAPPGAPVTLYPEPQMSAPGTCASYGKSRRLEGPDNSFRAFRVHREVRL